MNPEELVQDKWGRNSSSICWGEPIPISGNPNYSYEIQNAFPDFQWTFPSSTSATAVGYTYFAKEVTISGVTIPWNHWNPIHKDDVKAAYSLYIEKNAATSVDNREEFHFQIFPNPATSSIFIKTPSQNSNISLVELSSIEGKKIKIDYSRFSSNSWKINLPNTLSNGIYLLKIHPSTGIPFYKKVQIN